MLDLTHERVRTSGAMEVAHATLERLVPNVDGFWIHVDADVLDPTVVPAVDSPEPGGLGLQELGDLLTPWRCTRRRSASAPDLRSGIGSRSIERGPPHGAPSARSRGKRPILHDPVGFWERLARSLA